MNTKFIKQVNIFLFRIPEHILINLILFIIVVIGINHRLFYVSVEYFILMSLLFFIIHFIFSGLQLLPNNGKHSTRKWVKQKPN